jgi:hypothetical protein
LTIFCVFVFWCFGVSTIHYQIFINWNFLNNISDQLNILHQSPNIDTNYPTCPPNITIFGHFLLFYSRFYFPPLFTPIVSINTSNLSTPKSNIYYILTFSNSNLNIPTLSFFLNQYCRKWYVFNFSIFHSLLPNFFLNQYIPITSTNSSLSTPHRPKSPYMLNPPPPPSFLASLPKRFAVPQPLNSVLLVPASKITAQLTHMKLVSLTCVVDMQSSLPFPLPLSSPLLVPESQRNIINNTTSNLMLKR